MKSKNDKDILKRLGLRIRDLRLERAISQEELAAIANVHRTYIGMVERGEKNITILTLVRFSVALEINLIDILKGIIDGK
ncbi:MAG: XRE family transcriptional regulator [Alphaproteobacteria bacterium]|nr:MAG: XRE family transcriptional regulator [Alphaproteobacteria bacterium]